MSQRHPFGRPKAQARARGASPKRRLSRRSCRCSRLRKRDDFATHDICDSTTGLEQNRNNVPIHRCARVMPGLASLRKSIASIDGSRRSNAGHCLSVRSPLMTAFGEAAGAEAGD